MYAKLIKNDMKKNKLITVTITAFIFLAALLIAVAAALLVNLSGAVDNMMLQAKTPHVMQMHSGEVDMERLADFADTHENVEMHQVSEFLNIDGAEILIGDHTLAGSVQDNGLAMQSKEFDFLMDLDGEIVHPADGEIYVPIYYMKEGQANLGDAVRIHGTTFIVAGFIRDSQMNASMISSKRFLVSENDFEAIREHGRLESLIEFRLHDSSQTGAMEADYINAGLEANGPPSITYPLFKLANAMTDGMMIAVLILISLLVIIVTFLCIRFTLLAKVEDDYREIGVLKTIGLRVSDIKKLYLAKYGVISAIACVLGFLCSLLLVQPLMENIRLYMGPSNQEGLGVLFGAIGAGIILLVVILYVNGVLGRFRKISAAQAVRFGAPQEKSKSSRRFRLSENRLFSTNVFLGIKDTISRKRLYLTMLSVLVISSFIMIVPQNIYNTISSRDFMTYMGVGSCSMRVDVQQTDNIAEKTAIIGEAMAQDDTIAKHTVLTSMMFDMVMDDGTTQRMKVELGDHTVFPITYSKGNNPQKESEIAISSMNADELEKTVGDEITLIIDGAEKRLTICGIYSDITNGGKTAKGIFQAKQADILWTIIPVMFHDHAVTEGKISEYRQNYPFAKVSNIDDYLEQSFGSTVTAIQKASYAAIIASVLLTILVTLLFMKMLIAKDRYSIAVLKVSGFTSKSIQRQYFTRAGAVCILGIIIGTVLANTIGEFVGGALIASFGASTFHFEVNPFFAYLFSPLLIATCACIATGFGVADIRTLRVSEHIKE